MADLARLTSTYRHWVRRAESWDEADRKWKDHLLNDLWRLLAAEKAEEARNGGRDGIPADPLMEKAEKALSRQAYEPFSMRELAESLGLRPVPFTRRFYKHAGMTPSAYVTELRMNRACRLLTETNLPLDSVARQCGYENGFYLSRVFLERVGVRPSVYRKTRRV
ncbi:AraC family transcriptional regulator [Paenibacillus sp. CC-CFT747]|nr:AraC family transcriptional regulator [Paenibacillus sp. CC-CFT747]